MTKAAAFHGAAVDQRDGADWKIFDFDASFEQVNRCVTAADLGIAKKVNLAIRGRADVRGVAVENELFSGDEAGR